MIGEIYLNLPIKKFKIKYNSILLIIILLIVSSVAYVLCTYYLNNFGLNASSEYIIDKIAKLQTLKDILLVIISVCGANLLLSLIIETKSKNSLVTEIMLNDVISSPDFYQKMDDDKKIKMFNALEEHLYFKYNINHIMFKNMRDKIINMVCDYYYESCSYIVTCSVYDTYIEKEITKKVSLKSYDKKYTIKDFSIGSCSSKKIDGLDPYNLISFEINGEEIDLNKYMAKKSIKVSNLNKQNEYNVNMEYIYNKPLIIKNNEETILTVKCKTRTAIDDKSSTFRVIKPCKKFSLVYSITQNEKYRIGVDAFGFLDDADGSANNTSHSNINITFNDWIFEYDGVVVVILDK